MTLTSGMRLGPYEILAPIGAGGMGEVYRARDERLKRDVAIKVLPASYSSDADRLRRFEQEAQAAGALNHPNITAVYDIGSHEGAPYIVQELLEGENLRSRLSGEAFTPRRAIGHALQIASGLAAAHAKGIVHRDLKPENIFVTSDGRVKILDFGLAKLTQPEGVGSSATSLPTAAPGTEPGLVMGTVGYMSPEQVRGKFIDARSDIFSFGTILYEMLSGKRAFHGDTTADTMSAILTKEPPDLSETNRRVPEALERIVRHCLEKSPEARFQAASDIAFDLEAMSAGSLASGAQPAPRARRSLLRPLAVALGLGAALAVGHFFWHPTETPPPSYKRLTFRHGNLANARFTPDGESVVYAAAWDGKPLEIFAARLDGLESTPLGLPNADVLSVSRSGELAISIRERFLGGPVGVGTLARVPITGGVPRHMSQLVEFADWTPDGKELAITRTEAGKRQLEFPIGTVRYTTSNFLASPRFSPDGSRIAVIELGSEGYAIVVLNLGGEIRRVADHLPPSQRLAWSPDGREIWFDNSSGGGQSTISAVDLTGRQRMITRIPTGLTFFDISAKGRVLLERYTATWGAICRGAASTRDQDLGWFDSSTPITISHSGEMLLIAVGGDAGGTSGSFYLRRTDASPPVKLGDGWAFDLSPDGKFVLAKLDPAAGGLSLVPIGSGAAVPIVTGGLKFIDGGAFLPDGSRFLITGRESEKAPRLCYLQEGPTGRPRPIAPVEVGYSRPRPSPDGRSVLAIHDPNDDLYVLPLNGANHRKVPNTKGLEPVAWTPDGSSFFFASEAGSIPLRVFKVDATSGQRVPWGELGPTDLTGLIVLQGLVMTPDGKSYAYNYGRSASSDLFVVEGLK